MTKDEFIKECKKLNVIITDELYSKFERYFELLIEWNSKFNMTAILEKEDVFLLHFYDSICLIKSCDLNKVNSLCDFGTGAGFPGMVIAILYGNVNVTLIESNNKKCSFLNFVKDELNLKNVTIINTRIEEYGIHNRECFDIVTCRAVSSIPIILELSTSLVKVNGYLLPLKSYCDDELIKYKELFFELGLELKNKIDYLLPSNNASRTIPVFFKLKETNKKFPQKYSVILKKYKKKEN